MATTILFQTPPGGTIISVGSGTMELASVDVSANLNVRVVFAATTRGITFTVKCFSGATGNNVDLEASSDTIVVPANGTAVRLYTNVVARRLRATARLTSGTTTSTARLVVMGN